MIIELKKRGVGERTNADLGRLQRRRADCGAPDCPAHNCAGRASALEPHGLISRKKLPGPVSGEMVIWLFVPTMVATFVTFAQFLVLRLVFRCRT